MADLKLIDSHCHPQFAQYDNDRDAVVARSLAAGVGMVCVGTDLAMSRAAVALAKQYDGMWAAVGAHPTDEASENFELASYEPLIAEPKVVAVGEIGLDYYHVTDDGARALQRERFAQQITFAVEHEKPIIVHTRDAHDDTLAVLHDAHARYSTRLRGVIHSFTGSAADAARYTELGFCIGLNGIITFSDSYRDLVDKIPLDTLLLETDAPYLSPVPLRGKRNEPVNVAIIAEAIAGMRNMSTEEIQGITKENTLRLFNL